MKEQHMEGLLNVIQAAYEEYLAYGKFRRSEVRGLPHIISDVADRYWMDVERIKHFHSEINRINAYKIGAYLTYWICKLKPFYCEATAVKRSNRIAKLPNEIISFFISAGRIKSAYKGNEIPKLNIPQKIVDPLLYSLHFRRIEPDNLSIMYEMIELR